MNIIHNKYIPPFISICCLIISIIINNQHHYQSFHVDISFVSILISGTPILFNAIKKIIYNQGIDKISSSLLISIGTIASILIGDNIAAAEIVIIMNIGEILEDRTIEKAHTGLKKLISSTPQTARIIKNQNEIILPCSQLVIGDIIKILPGEIIPADGIITKGNTSINEAIINGESLPKDKSINDDVYCGTLNQYGTIEITVTSVGEDSSLQKLINLIKNSQNNHAPIKTIMDKVASWLVPTALLLAIITIIIKNDIQSGVTILVVFCPCALVLSTPTAIAAAIGNATRKGIILKSGLVLEKINHISTIAFDKTGTLTTGKLKISDIIPFNNDITELKLLEIVATIENNSEHPIAKAIVTHAKNNNIILKEIQNFNYYVGKGIIATINNQSIIIGNNSIMIEKNVLITNNQNKIINQLKAEGKIIVLCSIDNQLIGIVTLTDTLKNASNLVINQLNQLNIKSLLLSGDNLESVKYFADKCNIKDFYGNLLPNEKVETIKNLQSHQEIVCMIGDGINDAAAIKIADIGIAMGQSGSDLTNEISDISILNDDISKIPYLIKLAKITIKTIKICIIFSLLINFIAIILTWNNLLNPISGALFHNLGSIIVIIVATLLYNKKIK